MTSLPKHFPSTFRMSYLFLPEFSNFLRILTREKVLKKQHFGSVDPLFEIARERGKKVLANVGSQRVNSVLDVSFDSPPSSSSFCLFCDFCYLNVRLLLGHCW